MAKILPRKFRTEWFHFWYSRSWRYKYLGFKQIDHTSQYLFDNSKNLVFLTGSGRSGTQFFANFLNSQPEIMSFHEPNFREDVGTMDLLRRNKDLILPYYQKFRNLEIFKRMNLVPQKPIYCEVNGTIRYHLPALNALFPKSKKLLIIRNGASVVRSLIPWNQFYNKYSKGAYALEPLESDDFWDEWPNFTRFDRICWAWQEANNFAISHIPQNQWIIFEKAVSDYSYFKEKFCDYLNLDISKSSWNKVVSTKSPNSTKVYDFPEYGDWSDLQKERFKHICGPTMTCFGYDI